MLVGDIIRWSVFGYDFFAKNRYANAYSSSSEKSQYGCTFIFLKHTYLNTLFGCMYSCSLEHTDNISLLHCHVNYLGVFYLSLSPKKK